MASLVSILRFCVVFQFLIAMGREFFRWFAWNDNMALVLRSDIGTIKPAVVIGGVIWFFVWLSMISVPMWRLQRGAAYLYFWFLIVMPFIGQIEGNGRPGGIDSFDLLYALNGGLIFGLITFTALRKYFRVIPDPNGYPGLFSPRAKRRYFLIGAVFFFLACVFSQREHTPRACRCKEHREPLRSDSVGEDMREIDSGRSQPLSSK